MATIYNNKRLYVAGDNGSIPFNTISKQIFLTADIITRDIYTGGGSEYKNAILSPSCKCAIRVYLLNKDESLNRDISEYISAWNISFEYKQGSTRSGSITLINFNNEWSPSPVNGTVWKGTKFKILLGLYHQNVIYWKDCGIMVGGNISVDSINGTITIPLNDKFALLDGQIGGKRNYAFTIGAGTPIRKAIELCLTEKKIHNDANNTEVFDSKPIIFPVGTTIWNGKIMSYSEITTPYTITKDPNCTMGEIIIELAEMLTLDVCYNANGNLTLTPGAVTNDDLLQRAVMWQYEDNKNQYTQPSYDIEWDKLYNDIIVVGAIEGGHQFTGHVTNKSPKSQANVYLTEVAPLYIEDSNLFGDSTCETRAKYEMVKQGRLGISLKFDSIFIPHLECNNLILLSNERLNLVNEKFIVNSISISSNMTMNLGVSSVEEVSF